MKRTNLIKTSAAVLLGAAMLQGCGVSDLLNDLADALSELGTEDVELYTDAVGAELNDAVDMMGVMASMDGVGNFEPRTLSLADNGDGESLAPAFAPLAGDISACDSYQLITNYAAVTQGADPETVTFLHPSQDEFHCNVVNPAASTGVQEYTFYFNLYPWATSAAWSGYPILDGASIGVAKLAAASKYQLDPVTEGIVLVPAMNVVDFKETQSFDTDNSKGNTRVVTVENLEHADFTTAGALGVADVFNNWTKATKQIDFSSDGTNRLLKVVETFTAHMGGSPDFLRGDDLDPNGRNGVLDVDDIISKYTRLAEARNGRTRYTAAVAADGSSFYYDDEDLQPGTYSEVITLESGSALTSIDRVLTVTENGGSANEVFTFASGVTGYKNTTVGNNLIDIYGVRPDGTIEEISVDGSDEDAPVITRTVTFPEGRTVAKLEETWTPTETGGTIVRTITLDDGTTLDVTITISDGEGGKSTVTVDRGDLGISTLTIADGEGDDEGTRTITLAVTGKGDVEISATAVLDDLGTGEVDISIDNPATTQSPDLEGTLKRAADGSLSGTLTKYLESGDSIDVPVNRDSASPDRALEAIRGSEDTGADDAGTDGESEE